MKSTNAISTTGRIPAMAAPVAMPMNPVSEIGVSMIRSVPNSSAMPIVVPNTPPSLAMSSPIKNMFGCLRISLITASRPARAMVSVRSAFDAPVSALLCTMIALPLRVQPLERLLRRRIFAVAAKAHPFVTLLLPTRFEFGHLVGRQHRLGQQPLPIGRHRVFHRLALRIRAIATAVADEVPMQTLGLELENAAALAAPCALDRPSGGREDQVRVV